MRLTGHGQYVVADFFGGVRVHHLRRVFGLVVGRHVVVIAVIVVHEVIVVIVGVMAVGGYGSGW